MSIEAALGEESARDQRREMLFYSLLPYALLAASTTLALLQGLWGDPVSLPAVLALTAATALWLVWASRLRADGPRYRSLIALYYSGLIVSSAVLVVLAPWYGIFAFVGYIHAFLLLEGIWRYAGVVATSVIMSVSYVGGWDNIAGGQWGVWGAISLITVVLAATSFYFAESTHRQGRAQRRALEELHDANVKLESALEENAALQAQLLTHAREAGVLDERQRIARDIHDTLAQSLAGILTQLQAAEQSIGDGEALRRHLTSATDLARESLAEARRTVHAVEPEVLVGSLLPDAIADVTRGWSQAHRVHTDVAVTGEVRPLHPDVEVTLLRAAQEALANVAKHARASRVGLTLSYMSDIVTLDVRDDGVGFEPDAARTGSGRGGFGLTGMRQRVHRLAGRLVIESEPGGGTALSASLPAIPAGGRG